MNTVKSLRQSGFKLRVMHQRIVDGQLVPLYLIRKNNWQDKINPRGGFTKIEATSKDGRNYDASAKCSSSDNFNKHTALSKSIGRLMAKIESNITSDLVGNK